MKKIVAILLLLTLLLAACGSNDATGYGDHFTHLTPEELAGHTKVLLERNDYAQHIEGIMNVLAYPDLLILDATGTQVLGMYIYDPETGLYMIGQYKKPYIDGNTGEQVGTTNLFILRTSVVNSGDYKGHMNIDVRGSGKGTYICGGKATEIKWYKETINDPFTYTLADGSPFSLGVGKSYVCVVSNNATVTIS